MELELFLLIYAVLIHVEALVRSLHAHVYSADKLFFWLARGELELNRYKL